MRKITNEKSIWELLNLGSQIGFSICIPIIVGVLLGKELDTKFNLTPKLTLTCIFFGLVVSLYSVKIIIKRMINR